MKSSNVISISIDLDKYETGSFRFRSDENLKTACKAPHSKSGVYKVYIIDEESNEKELVYIGSSGHIENDGKLFIRGKKDRKEERSGLWERLVHGHQFQAKRFKSWPDKMKQDKIGCLEIEWHVTHEPNGFIDSPCYVEYVLLHLHYTQYKKLPKWNQKF